MPFLYVLFFWLYVPYKIISWIVDTFIGNPIQRAIDNKVAKAETDKAFGKLNQDIEIYDPSKSSKPTQKTTQPLPDKPLAKPQQKPKARP